MGPSSQSSPAGGLCVTGVGEGRAPCGRPRACRRAPSLKSPPEGERREGRATTRVAPTGTTPAAAAGCARVSRGGEGLARCPPSVPPRGREVFGGGPTRPLSVSPKRETREGRATTWGAPTGTTPAAAAGCARVSSVVSRGPRRPSLSLSQRGRGRRGWVSMHPRRLRGGPSSQSSPAGRRGKTTPPALSQSLPEGERSKVLPQTREGLGGCWGLRPGPRFRARRGGGGG